MDQDNKNEFSKDSLNNSLFSKLKVYERLMIFSAVLMVLLISLTVYFYAKTQVANSKITKNNIETNRVIEALGKIVVLPQGEEPTVATISDVEKVNNQAFFTNAKNGDKVLIYVMAKKAFLYRPSENKLVEVAPLTE